ncbi:hypothetical protein DOY81_000128, partial [Sarcophaga bullata]
MKVFALVLSIFALISSAIAIKNAACGLKNSVDGNGLIACAAYIPSWSYKADSNECVEFIYGGCGGNLNRFNSRKECEDMCK